MTPEQIKELLRDANGLAEQASVLAARSDELYVRAAREEALADPSLNNLLDKEVEFAVDYLLYLYDQRQGYSRKHMAEVEALMSFGDNLPDDKESSSNEEYRRRVVRLYRRFTK